MRFPALCRELRLARRLKQREVADAIGIKANSYGNVEVTNHKTINRERVLRLARFHELDEARTAELVAAWEELPESDYNKRQTKSFAQRREGRSKARNHDLLLVSLLEVTTLLVTSVPEGALLCACTADDADEWGAAPESITESCELCTALERLGVADGYTTRDEVIAKLAAVQEGMAS
jgi:transcriptional regulator with XRE-family HTH domain